MRTHLSILLLLAGAGCNEVTTFTDAGGDDDSTVDGATSPDGAPAAGTVTVITRTRYVTDGPVEGSQVIAVGVDGTLRDSATTDATGTATLDVVAGDSVTAIYPIGPNSSQDLVTTVAVEPGDTLTYGTYYGDTSTTNGTLVVTWPAGTEINYWYVYTDCYATYVPGTTLTTTMSRYPSCGDDTTDVLIVGYANGDGYPSQWARLEDVAWASGVANFTAYQNAPAVTIAGSGIPPEIDYIEIGAGGQLGPTRVYGPYASASPPVDGAFSLSARLVVGDGGFGNWSAYRYANGLGGQQGTIGMTSATELRLDDPALLPFVSRPEINGTARQAIWIQTEGAPYDVAYFTMSYNTAPPAFLPGLGGAQYYNWSIILPPGVTQLEFPAMPEGYEQHLPPPGVFIYGDVMLLEDERYDGYDGGRNAPEWQVSCSYNCPVDLAMPRRTWSRYGGK